MEKIANNLEPSAQRWVRAVEDSITALERQDAVVTEINRTQTLTMDALTNTTSTLAAQQQDLSSQQAQLSAAQSSLQATQDQLGVTQTDLATAQAAIVATQGSLQTQITRIDLLTTRISETTTSGSFSASTNATATLSTQAAVVGPSWATRAMVVAGAVSTSRPVGAWEGTIELIAKNVSIVRADFGKYIACMSIGVDPVMIVPQSNPMVVSLAANKTLYLRPVGAQGGPGNINLNYTNTYTYAITWM